MNFYIDTTDILDNDRKHVTVYQIDLSIEIWLIKRNVCNKYKFDFTVIWTFDDYSLAQLTLFNFSKTRNDGNRWNGSFSVITNYSKRQKDS